MKFTEILHALAASKNHSNIIKILDTESDWYDLHGPMAVFIDGNLHFEMQAIEHAETINDLISNQDIRTMTEKGFLLDLDLYVNCFDSRSFDLNRKTTILSSKVSDAVVRHHKQQYRDNPSIDGFTIPIRLTPNGDITENDFLGEAVVTRVMLNRQYDSDVFDVISRFIMNRINTPFLTDQEKMEMLQIRTMRAM